MLAPNAETPKAELVPPVVRTSKEFAPTAVLLSPDVSAAKTPTPTPVLEDAESKNLDLTQFYN